MLGKAAATSIAAMHKSAEDGFIYIKGPEILSKFVGEAEERIREIFRRARSFHAKNNVPAIIFIDEAESILAKRGSTKSSDVDKTIVPQFLAEMDGMEDSGAIVILTTNRADILDPAIVREGRIDKKIYIGNPDDEAMSSILQIHMQGTLVDGSIDQLIAHTISELGSDVYPMYEVAFENNASVTMMLKDFVSGAALAALVKTMITSAMRRDITSKSRKATGVSCADATTAVADLYKQYRKMEHADFLASFQEMSKEDGMIVKSITKSKNVQTGKTPGEKEWKVQIVS